MRTTSAGERSRTSRRALRRARDGTAPRTGLQALRQLLVHVRPVRAVLLAGLLLLVVSTLVALVQPLAAQAILDGLTAGGELRGPVLLLVAVVLLSAVTQGFGNYLVLRGAEDVVLGSRRRLVSQIFDLSLGGMRGQSPGDLMSRVTSDTALIRQVCVSSMVQFVTGSVALVGAVVLMLTLDVVLLAVTVAVVLVPAGLLGVIMPRVRRAARETQEAVGRMGSELERVLGAFTTLKASAAEDEEDERFRATSRRARDAGVRSSLWTALAAMTSALSVQAAFLVVLGVGALRVQSGAMTVPVLIAFLLYAMQLSAPVVQLTAAVSSFQTGRAALERVAEVESMEREMDVEDFRPADGGAVAELPVAERAPGSLAALGPISWSPAAELHDVTFRYPDAEEPALRDLSVTIPERGTTGVVGPSGSGKSSILRLLKGFFPVEAGQVVVGGRDLVEWDLTELRQHTAYVEQETPVLAGSLRDNLEYGLEDVDDERLRAVLVTVRLHERFAAPGALDAELGHRGASLSGGERQRIAIARAILREPRLLLLDEATSQLDARTEAVMRDVVADLARHMSVVVVAHRLSTVVDAEQIVVLEAGRQRAVGRHQELVERDEVYRRLVQEQTLPASAGPSLLGPPPPAPPGSTATATSVPSSVEAP
ncbi:ABC transporter ATP-binding protein [uncultured Pseudokineococcus sp.]|uniref:ABC transporter ATP-binding protein n=1 Tax=uncultured Pseudokineococcus sp. TaxID=1642928 RepID=UPI00261305CB|nr:ABC transporter ATP-binding protein [uncultured Pseudokineococcus sp.]